MASPPIRTHIPPGEAQLCLSQQRVTSVSWASEAWHSKDREASLSQPGSRSLQEEHKHKWHLRMSCSNQVLESCRVEPGDGFREWQEALRSECHLLQGATLSKGGPGASSTGREGLAGWANTRLSLLPCPSSPGGTSVRNHALCYYCISQSLKMCAPGQSSNTGPFLGGQGQDYTSVNSSRLCSPTISARFWAVKPRA